MIEFANDPSIYLECNQWRAVYSTPSVNDNCARIFSNFGSLNEDIKPVHDTEELVNSVAIQFAMDVYSELKSELQSDPTRIKTSHTERKAVPQKPYAPHKTPSVTPHNSRRGSRNNHSILQPYK